MFISTWIVTRSASEEKLVSSRRGFSQHRSGVSQQQHAGKRALSMVKQVHGFLLLLQLSGTVGQRIECSNMCIYPVDGDCDDGGPGAEFTSCQLGTDCFDCGSRVVYHTHHPHHPHHPHTPHTHYPHSHSPQHGHTPPHDHHPHHLHSPHSHSPSGHSHSPQQGTNSGAESGAADPCFPSTATVTKADGGVVSIASLKEGDIILAAAADGTLTTDTVSLLSIAKPEATATFISLTTAAGKSLNLTAEHHLPVGPACCSALRKAKDIAIGETVWTVSGGATDGATVAATVSGISRALNKGLHSPVLAAGGFPIIDGFVTSFDDLRSVTLASYGLPHVLRACKAMGTCPAVQRAIAALAGRSTADLLA